jgi:NADP-reducing hydrogenase subunit HndB
MPMPELTLDDLKRIKEKTAAAMALRLGHPRATITVHVGDCGIAAGARDVMQALLGEVSESRRPDVQVLAADCVGNCASEPNVTVWVEGSEPVVYQKMDRDKIKQVFRRHLLEGEVLREHVLSR